MYGEPYNSRPLVTYQEGSTINVTMIITAHHMGHVELKLCDQPGNPTQACFDAHPLQFVSEVIGGNPPDPNYPERGYLRPNDGSAIPVYGAYSQSLSGTSAGSYGSRTTGMMITMLYKLPEGLICEHCLLSWYYLTANSCTPPGDYNGAAPEWTAATTCCCQNYLQGKLATVLYRIS
eukprot:gene3644-4579_t